MPYRIQCLDLVKHYGTARVLDGIRCTVEPGGVLGLVGSSGAGKTTLLRVIAGLDHPTSGSVKITTRGSAAKVRAGQIGMVFQNLALWPHLTARQHLECVLAPLGGRERRRRAAAVLNEARIPHAAWDRRPAELSGGESQRLALARALATEPEILLLDEPLAQVDTVLRAELLDLIGGLIRARQVTTVYVTHFWDEVVKLSGQIGVLMEGRLAAEGTPDEVFWNPPTAAVARLTGPVIELPRRLLEQRLVEVDKDFSPLGENASGDRLERVIVRPQQLRLTGPCGRNCWEPRERRPSGDGWLTVLAHAQSKWTVSLIGEPPPDRPVGIRLWAPAGCTSAAVLLKESNLEERPPTGHK